MAPAFMRSAPPTLPGMPSRNSSPVKPMSLGFDRHVFQLRAGAAVQPRARDFDPAEVRVRQANHHAAKTAVAHQQIRAAAQHEKAQLLFGAKLQHRRQIRFRRRLDVEVRRTADPQGGVSGQRFVGTDQRVARNALCQRIGSGGVA